MLKTSIGVGMQQEAEPKSEWEGVPRKKIIDEVTRLRDSVSRLSRTSAQPAILRHASHTDDFVPAGWSERNGIEIPRADGIFESPTAWVRIKHGVIIDAGLKNQSILSLMVSMELLDAGWVNRAAQYKDWRTAFLASVDPVKWTAEEGRGDPETWSKEDRYSKLQRRVDQDHIAAMDCIVSGRPKARQLAAFQANQEAFVGAFKTVAQAMAEIDREAEKALEAARHA